jgi:hypothetical protein
MWPIAAALAHTVSLAPVPPGAAAGVPGNTTSDSGGAVGGFVDGGALGAARDIAGPVGRVAEWLATAWPALAVVAAMCALTATVAGVTVARWRAHGAEAARTVQSARGVPGSILAVLATATAAAGAVAWWAWGAAGRVGLTAALGLSTQLLPTSRSSLSSPVFASSSCPGGGSGWVLCAPLTDSGSEPGAGLVGWVARASDWVINQWPVLVIAVGTVAFIATVLTATAAAARCSHRMRDAEQAVWLDVVPPPGPLADGAALAVWRVLAGALARAPYRLIAGPPLLSAELYGDHGEVRAGIWVPPPINPAALADALRRAWPGSAITQNGTGPDWLTHPVTALTLSPTGGRAGVWAPLIDPTTPATRAGTPAADAAQEPLRAVLAALAARGRGEHAAVHLILNRHRPHTSFRDRFRDHDTTTGALGGVLAVAGSALGAVAGWALRCAGRVLLGLLRCLLPGPTRPAHSGGARGARAGSGMVTGLGTGVDAVTDPEHAAAVKARLVKRAHGPHLRVTMRVVVAAGPIRGRARHASTRRVLAARIAAGYDVTLTQPTALRGRWAWLAVADRVATRTPARTGGFYATLPELATLWHLPADPVRWGMPAAPATQRPTGTRVPRLPHHPTSERWNRPPHAGPDRSGWDHRPGGGPR